MYKNIIVYKNFLSKKECKKIIKYAKENIELHAGKIGSNKEVSADIRISDVGWIQRNDKSQIIQDLFSKIDNIIDNSNKRFFDIDVYKEGCSSFQYTVYRDEQKSYYNYHCDSFLPGGFPDQRKISCVIQLSSPKKYKGGELMFRDHQNSLDEDISQRGTLIIFPSIYYHCVTPITQGTRRSLVAWYSGPSWR